MTIGPQVLCYPKNETTGRPECNASVSVNTVGTPEVPNGFGTLLSPPQSEKSGSTSLPILCLWRPGIKHLHLVPILHNES